MAAASSEEALLLYSQRVTCTRVDGSVLRTHLSAHSDRHVALLVSTVSPSDPNVTRMALGVWLRHASAHSSHPLVTLTTLPRHSKTLDTSNHHHSSQESGYSMAWSHDGKVLAVVGAAGASATATLWLFTRADLIDSSVTGHSTPLVMARPLADAVGTSDWGAGVAATSVFFRSGGGGGLCVVAADAKLFVVDAPLQQLALRALARGSSNGNGDGNAGDDDADGALGEAVRGHLLLAMGNWHAGVTAAAFDTASDTLVVGGGLANASDELVRARASSLSVWKMAAEAELLDYTVVVGDEAAMDEQAEAATSAASESSALHKVKSSLLSPLRFIVGESVKLLEGSVTSLALSPSAARVAMVDKNGRVAVRQIDACADVVPWQLVQGQQVCDVCWFDLDVLHVLLQSGEDVFLSLKANVNDEDYEIAAASMLQMTLLPVESHGDVKSTENGAMTMAISAVHAEANIVALVNKSAVEISYVDAMQAARLVDVLMASKQFNKALEVAQAHGVRGEGIDQIHRTVWNDFVRKHTHQEHSAYVLLGEYEREEWEDALQHLAAVVADPAWVVTQCSSTIAPWFVDMKELLAVGLRCAVSSDATSQTLRSTLLRSYYRLHTLRAIVAAELEESPSVANALSVDQLHDPTTFAWFRDASVLTLAKEFAFAGRLAALKVLFQRNGYTLVPARLEILGLIPATISPTLYADLLPAVRSGRDEEWQFCTLAAVDGDPSRFEVVESVLLDENRTYDLVDDDVAVFDASARQDGASRKQQYALWFTNRMLEMDAVFGQLRSAYELARLARWCLGRHDHTPSTPFDDFFRHTERLQKCVYELRLASCELMPLTQWCELSIVEQADVATQGVTTAEQKFHVLEAAFLQVPHEPYAIDDVFVSLCREFAQENTLPGLELCAKVMYQSNPSNPMGQRWVQSDSLLIRTAIDVIYAVQADSFIKGHANVDANKATHKTFVDRLWAVFQSLPARKDDDSPEISRLQVEVDGLEDLMVAMDVLAKYDIFSSPAEIRVALREDKDRYAVSLLTKMCAFALSPTRSEQALASKSWMSVWGDAVELKKHVFGETLAQNAILEVILKHLFADPCYLSAAEELIANYVSANMDVVGPVLKIVIDTIKTKVDNAVGSMTNQENSDLVQIYRCAAIVKRLLTTPSLKSTPEGQKLVHSCYSTLNREMSIVRACQLLELLTYGAKKVKPAEVRALKAPKDRAALVLEVFSSNPTNYRPSRKALEWMKNNVSSWSEDDAQDIMKPVLHLATLLHVTGFTRKILMKGAYAALYSQDYEAAYLLTKRAFEECMNEDSATEERDDDFVLLSLVLDLVSTSSFFSWQKKLNLCRLSFASSHFDHCLGSAASDHLMTKMQVLDAVESLAAELGLSEQDVERRKGEIGRKCSVEELLFKELDIVVDLLKEEKKDIKFLLALLQKGFSLAQITLLAAEQHNHRGSSEFNPQEWASNTLRQLSSFTFDMVMLDDGTLDDDDWSRYLELMLGYLLLINDQEPTELIAMWTDVVLPRLTPEASSAKPSDNSRSERLVRAFHHFFLFLGSSQGSTQDIVVQESANDVYQAWYSYSATKQRSTTSRYEPEGDEQQRVMGDTTEIGLAIQEHQHLYVQCAEQCQARMLSQKKSQELEEINVFFNTELDVEQFATNQQYREDVIFQLATKQEQFQLAIQFALKYGVEEYACVLAYIRHVFLPSEQITNRHEQLEHAFRTDKQDFLEMALQRPHVFGEFLLKPDGIYASLDGSDHVGILLVLRMVLECSKRAAQSQEQPTAWLPLAKTASERVTLLFMCLKRLKELTPAEGSAAVDFKLICGATSTADLFNQVDLTEELLHRRRVDAIQATLPFLNSKTIKMVTKILQKVHRMSASSIVMIYLNDMVTKIWHEQGNRESLNADLAAYAYESCVPFLSVLSNDHLMLFHCLFLGKTTPKMQQIDMQTEFYGQALSGISHFGPHLTKEKEMELVADTLTLFQHRAEQTTGAQPNEDTSVRRKTEEIAILEREMLHAGLWFVLDVVHKQDLFVEKAENDWEKHVVDLQKLINEVTETTDVTSLLDVLQPICERISDVLIVMLITKITTSCVGFAEDDASSNSTTVQLYRRMTKSVIAKKLDSASWSREMIGNLSKQLLTKPMDEPSQLQEMSHLLATCMGVCDTSNQAEVRQSTVAQLEQSPAPTLREIGCGTKAMLNSTEEPAVLTAVRDAVCEKWRDAAMENDQAGRHAECAAILTVLCKHAPTASNQALLFGARVKAACAFARDTLKDVVLDSVPSVLSMPLESLLESFDVVFHAIAAPLQVPERARECALQTLQHLTLIAANLLIAHDQLTQLSTHEHTWTWAQEQQDALKLRVCAAFFGETPASARDENASQTSFKLWQVLLLFGQWDDDDFFQWYTDAAYGKIVSPDALNEYCELNWQARTPRVLKLLLMAPVAPVREQQHETMLKAFHHLVSQPQGLGAPGIRELLELLLLRVDLADLLAIGFYPCLLAWHRREAEQLHDDSKERQWWTSSPEYMVARLITMNEFACAARIVCALWNAHALLWDAENARLLLANYLKALPQATPASCGSRELEQTIQQVYKQIERRVHDEFSK